MSMVFSRNKTKRSRSTSSEDKNSFVKNVTSKVSGLLPAVVTKWFSSPSTSSANGSTATVEITDSSTEDEATEAQVSQPPIKRMRYNSPKFNHVAPTDANCTINSDSMAPCNQYSTVQSTPGRTTFIRDTNYVSTPLRSSNEDASVENSEKDTVSINMQHTFSSSGSSIESKRKSLFSKDLKNESLMKSCVKTSCNTVNDPKKPSFKPALLGSLFYPGQTMYGGAASAYMNTPNIQQRKSAYVNKLDSTTDNTISHSTRRVMDLLECYSSPLIEAKRIPHIVKGTNDSLHYMSNICNSSNKPRQMERSYKTQELHVPTMATIMRYKQRSRLMNTTNTARKLIASQSSSNPDYFPYLSDNKVPKKRDETDSVGKMTTKIKTKLTRTNRGDDLKTAPFPPVTLGNVILEIDKTNLPNFSFSNSVVPKVTPTSTQISSLPVISSTPSVDSNITFTRAETVFNDDAYTFSSPVKISSIALEASKTPSTFVFGIPKKSIDRSKVDEKKSNETAKIIENKLTVSKSKDWQCSDCWVFNKPDIDKCVCCGGKKPSNEGKSKAKCSLCKSADVKSSSNMCVNCEKVQINDVNKLPVPNHTDTAKFKCPDCWVNNDSNAEKCVCCGAKNPNKAIASEQNTTMNNEDKDTDWKCNGCYIENKNGLHECAACGLLKPDTKQSSDNKTTLSMGFKPPDNTLKNDTKAEDKWECPICLVRNASYRSMCICCEADRPGLNKKAEKIKFNFGSNTSFKFGSALKTQETSTAQNDIEAKNIDSKAKLEESETNNNVVSKPPTFTFGIPANKTPDQVNTTEGKGKSVLPSFVFGQTSEVSTLKTPITFGIPNKISESTLKTNTEEQEKSQVVPKIDLILPKPDLTQPKPDLTESKPDLTQPKPNLTQPKPDLTPPKLQETPKPLPVLFSSPLTKQSDSEKPSEVISTVLKQTVSHQTENKDTVTNSLVSQQATTSTEVPQKSMFAFGAANIKSPSNVFGSSVSVSTTSSITFGSPAQSTLATVTPSIFQKSESIATTSPSLFQKSDTLTSSTPLFQAKTEPTTTTSISLFQKSTPALSTSISLFQKDNGSVTTSQTSLFQKSKLASNSTVSLFQKNENSTTTTTAPSVAVTAPIFSFGSNNQTAQHQEAPKFNFSFGSGNKTETSALFKSATTFGTPSDNNINSNPNKFTFGSSTGNTIGSGNTLASNNPLGGGNGLSAGTPLTGNTLSTGSNLAGGTLGGNGLQTNPLSSGLSAGNGLQNGSGQSTGTGGIFGAPAQKENMWSSSNTTNFAAYKTNLQKPEAFTFGSSTAFNSNNAIPTFGSSNTQQQPAANVFGLSNQSANNNNQPSLFSNPVQNQPATNIFGSPQSVANPASTLSIFGTSNTGPAPTFGAANSAIPAFESTASLPTPPTTFNFGASSQQPSVLFGFGQQPQQQQAAQQGASGFTFGGNGGPLQVQFSMGSSPNMATRRVRRAIRRNPQR